MASAIADLALRGSSFAVVLISVPLTLGLLGPVRFGMWITLASVVALLGATDLGIGNGVKNNIAHAFGQGDATAVRRYLASGFIALTGISAVFGAIFVALYPVLPWAKLYNVAADPTAASEAGPATAVFVATFLLSMPLGLASQVRSAYQEGFIQSAFAGLGNAGTLVLLLVAIWQRANLPVLVLAMTAAPLIAAAANLFVLIRFQRPTLVPRWSDVTIGALRSVVGVGLAFMVLQIAYIVAFSSDPLVVAQIVGPVGVADYSVVFRLFSIPAGLAVIGLQPLWPAYREAISRCDVGWVRLTLRRSLLLTIVATVPLAVVLSIVGPALVGLWTSHVLSPTAGLYPALGAFTVAFGVANVFAMLLNGAQAMRFQVSTMVLMAVLNLAASIYLAFRIGVAGVVIGSVISLVAVLIIPAAMYIPRMLHRLERDGSTKVGSISLDESLGFRP